MTDRGTKKQRRGFLLVEKLAETWLMETVNALLSQEANITQKHSRLVQPCDEM